MADPSAGVGQLQLRLPEDRVLVLASRQRDRELLLAAIRSAGVACFGCADADELAREATVGVAAVVASEDALRVRVKGSSVTAFDVLARIVGEQPPWSDLPILLLVRAAVAADRIEGPLLRLGNLQLVARPTPNANLVNAVRTALRARARQYQSRAQLQALEQSDRRKDNFIAMLAHELRNPLAPMRHSVALLERMADLPAAGRSSTATLTRQIDHMVRLVDDLLELGRVTRGTIQLRRRRVSLEEIVDSALEVVRPELERCGHRLAVDLSCGDAMLEVDATRIAQVLSNLLGNAVKYTPPGGRIALSAACCRGMLELHVEDDGRGIEPESLERIFDMFEQEGTAQGADPAGLGIGLALVRTLVELHGGRAYAHSEGRGRGSRFTVELPMPADSQPLSGSAWKTHARVGAGGGPLEQEPTMKPVPATAAVVSTVLVADDNIDAATSLGELLELADFRVSVAHSGVEALQRYQQSRFDAVILDLGMPGMDGVEVAQRIRRSETDHTVLIALTGWGQRRDRERTRAAGFDHHLVKPAGIDAIVAALRGAPIADRPL